MTSRSGNLSDHLPTWFNREWQSPQPVPPGEALYEFFRTSANAYDMATTAGSYRITCPAGKMLLPSRVLWTLEDVNITYFDFAGLGAALTNGILVRIADSGDNVLLDFLDGVPIKTTADFARLAGGDIGKVVTSAGVDPDLVVARWSLFKAGFVPWMVEGDYFEIKTQDTLSNLDVFHAVIQGRVCDAP
jgi:hypothetical protein